MNEEELIKIAIGEALNGHKTLGPGLFESVYKTCLAHDLRKLGLFVEVEKRVPLIYKGVHMECGYRADIVVEQKIIIDTKHIEAIGPIHISQVLTYLRLLNLRHGLIINFNNVLLKNGIRRVLNGFERII